MLIPLHDRFFKILRFNGLNFGTDFQTADF